MKTGTQQSQLRAGSEGKQMKEGWSFRTQVNRFFFSVAHHAWKWPERFSRDEEESLNPPEPLMNPAGHAHDPCTNVSNEYLLAKTHSYTLR